MVKIFDHMLFLAVSQFDNISRRKLIWIASYGLVNHLGCYAIQFSNISVKDNLRISDDNDFTFCFYNIFLMSHNFFFKSYSGTKKMQTSAKKACFQFAECSFSSAKKMQTSGKKACFQFAECSFSSAKIRLFLVTSKVLGKKYLKRGRRTKKNRRLPELRAAY